MKTEHVFENEDYAREAAAELNQYGGQRNKCAVVAVREGCKVSILPEWASAELARFLGCLVEAFEVPECK